MADWPRATGGSKKAPCQPRQASSATRRSQNAPLDTPLRKSSQNENPLADSDGGLRKRVYGADIWC